MNKATTAMLQRTINASILAFLFFVGRAALNWPWLAYLALAAAVYAVVCLLYTLFLWRNSR